MININHRMIVNIRFIRKGIFFFGTEIKQPKIEDKEADKKLTEQSAFQWWVAVLVGLAIIAIIVAVITTTSSIRRIKMR